MGAFQGQRPHGPGDNESTRRYQEALAKGQAEERLRNMEERLKKLEEQVEELVRESRAWESGPLE